MIKNINFTHVITIAFTCGVIAVFYHFYNLKNDIKITVIDIPLFSTPINIILPLPISDSSKIASVIDDGSLQDGHEKVATDFTSSEIAAKLAAAATQEERAEYAAVIAASGQRPDILGLFSAIEVATGDDRETLARSLQALNNPEIASDLLSFLIRNVDDPVVADQARDALARIIAPEDISQINQTLPVTPEKELVRSYLLDALSRITNPDSVNGLVQLCERSKDAGVYSSAATALGEIGTPEAVSSMITLIEDTATKDVNHPFSKALMSVTNKDARPLMEEEFIETTNPVVLYAMAYALGALSD
jgi:HEAT repeat protein